MEQLDKPTRKLLREALDLAYQKELGRELAKLHAAFERWQQGEVSPFDLSDAIHAFHQGPNRTLYLRYVQGDQLLMLAGAVSAEILRPEELHPDLRPHVQRVLQVLKPAESTAGARPGAPGCPGDHGG